jgi:hypothetical protein
MFELRNLDEVLNKKMTLIGGLLFSTEVTGRLTQSIIE